MGLRQELIAETAGRVVGLGLGRTTRVAVDGVDGAGKTVFADELGGAIEGLSRAVIRAGVDSFHNPREVRHRRGRGSPEGFYRDSFDCALLRSTLLDPLSPGGTGRYRRAAFDHETDAFVESAVEVVPDRAILVFDGIFLHRPELLAYWDYSIFLRTGFEVSIPRLAQRVGGSPDPDAASNRRYIEGQRLYLSECQPADRASVVIDNQDLAAPFIARG